MKKTLKIASVCLTALIGVCLPQVSSATTLQFENLAPAGGVYLGSGGSDSYSESGYVLSNLAYGYWAIVSKSDGEFGPFGPTSNSDFFSTVYPPSQNIVLTQQKNATFSLNSIDLGAVGPAGIGGVFNFQGITNNSLIVNYSVTLTDTSWHTLSFMDNPNFQNLKSLDIQFIPQNSNSMALDNINVSTVPLPSGLYLLGSALLPLTSRASRKISKTRRIS